MSTSFPSPMEPWLIGSLHMYCNAPQESMKRLKALWKEHQASAIIDGSELSNMVYVLAQFFGDSTGNVVHNGQVVGRLEGGLWDACLAAKLPLLAMDFIKDGFFVKQSAVWVQSVLVINARFASLWADRAHPHASKFHAFFTAWSIVPTSLVKQYFQAMGPVWDVLWRERGILLSKKGHGNAARLVVFADAVIRLLKFIYTSTEYRSELTTCPSIVSIALASWTHAATTKEPLPSPFERFAFDVVTCYLDCTSPPSNPDGYVGDFHQDVINMAVKGVGPSKFMKACHDAISSWPHMIGVNLNTCLEALYRMVSFDKDFDSGWPIDLSLVSRRAFWDFPMLEAIVKALERESRPAAGDIAIFQQPAAHLGIFTRSLELLRFTSMSFILLVENPPAAHGRSVYDILSKCMLSIGRSLGTGYRESQMDAVIQMNIAVNSAMGQPDRTVDSTLAMFTANAVDNFRTTCVNWELRFRDYKLPASAQTQGLVRLLQEIKAAAYEAWYVDLCALCTLRDQHGEDKNYISLVQSWILFGEAAGLKEAAERERHDSRQKHICAWANCAYHKQPASTELRACTGCRKQRYCSRECQTKDWKEGGHRRKCQKLNA